MRAQLGRCSLFLKAVPGGTEALKKVSCEVEVAELAGTLHLGSCEGDLGPTALSSN